ncbi:hypothetical protein DFH08DRAFT_899033 [Mycena albidolilacea]|uniref:Uncharacterized protein n=1 Tax=Mycena albidolilacea TaxID=1033008 RepID=A0AAD6Z6B7_9AGAR|nr:hypothetical protein DFH08DRAFT_899033 [Mycena albidolilacea]
MSAAPELDRSWDVGELHHISERFIATRPRPEDRPEARKILLGHYMDGAPDLVERRFKEALRRVVDEGRAQHQHDIEQLAGRFDREHREVVDEGRAEHRKHIDWLDREHREVVNEVRAEHLADSIRVQRSIFSIQNRLVSHTERTVVFNDVAEGYEVLARSLEGLNDLIFDVERQARHPGDVLLTAIEKETLNDVDALHLKAFDILSPQQQRLCRGLLDVQESDGRRNFLHHPRPDRDTAMDRVGDFLDEEDQNTLREFLKTDPKRIPSRRERTRVADPDLFLFAREGEYKNVAAQKVDLENLSAKRADIAAYLEALEQKAA